MDIHFLNDRNAGLSCARNDPDLPIDVGENFTFLFYDQQMGSLATDESASLGAQRLKVEWPQIQKSLADLIVPELDAKARYRVDIIRRRGP
jgi:hypothetical protein